MEGNVDRVDCNERVKKMFEAGAMTSIRVTHTERKRAHWHTDTHSHLDGGANDRQMAKVDVATSQSVAIGRRRSFCPENQNPILPDAVSIRRFRPNALKVDSFNFEKCWPKWFV